MVAKTVPITGAVLRWALEEAGIRPLDLGERLGVTEADIRDWITERSRPTKGQFTKLSQALRRPSAIFFLPEPPTASLIPAEFRKARGKDSRTLGVVELRQVRRARRLQSLLSWIRRERGGPGTSIPMLLRGTQPGVAGREIREALGVSPEDQLAWNSESVAFAAWRSALSRLGVLVFQLQLGAEGIRGFSAHDDYAPLIVTNTAENLPARVFTVFHEYAHLVSRTDAACETVSVRSRKEDLALERWCEEVAAAALMPEGAVRKVVREIRGSKRPPEDDFALARRVGGKFKVSIRAAGIRLMRLKLSPQDLYAEIERRARPFDREKRGGGRGGGQPAFERRLGEVGRETVSALVEARDTDLLTERDLRDSLRLDGTELDTLRAVVA